MSAPRFGSLEDTRPASSGSLSRPSVSGFVMCPLAVPQGMTAQMLMWQQAYQLAFEQARAVLQPSLLDRLVPSLN